MRKAHVVTVSDGVSHGTREDRSGPSLVGLLSSAGFETGAPQVVSDDVEQISEAILTAVSRGVDLVVTTGGTGLGPRDVTPQAASALFDYEVPGLGEAMRAVGIHSTPMAALSRSGAGVRERTLIINVPGSARGAMESLEAVLPMLEHAVQLLHGDTSHH